MIGAVHAGGVINRVSTDFAPFQSKLDPALLREAEISALSNDFAPQLATFDPNPIVCAISDLGMGLVGCLNLGTNPAVIKEIDRRF